MSKELKPDPSIEYRRQIEDDYVKQQERRNRIIDRIYCILEHPDNKTKDLYTEVINYPKGLNDLQIVKTMFAKSLLSHLKFKRESCWRLIKTLNKYESEYNEVKKNHEKWIKRGRPLPFFVQPKQEKKFGPIHAGRTYRKTVELNESLS